MPPRSPGSGRSEPIPLESWPLTGSGGPGSPTVLGRLRRPVRERTDQVRRWLVWFGPGNRIAGCLVVGFRQVAATSTTPQRGQPVKQHLRIWGHYVGVTMSSRRTTVGDWNRIHHHQQAQEQSHKREHHRSQELHNDRAKHHDPDPAPSRALQNPKHRTQGRPQNRPIPIPGGKAAPSQTRGTGHRGGPGKHPTEEPSTKSHPHRSEVTRKSANTRPIVRSGLGLATMGM